MPRPNAGGGRHNQSNNDPTVPRRALFSNWNQNKGGGKGSGKGERDGKGKGKRPVFESQKELDKWKGAQKGQQQSQPQTQRTSTGATPGAEVPALWQKTDNPSYIHGTFCLTHDDHVVLEPLLNLAGRPEEKDAEGLPPDVAEDAAEHLKALGILPAKIATALAVIGPPLVWELAEREATVTARAAAERALEWFCSVTEESSLPSRLRESREVTAWRRRQEERNVTFQTRALMMGGEIDSNNIVRIEKLGFPRAKAIEALARAPNHELIPAVHALLSAYLPLELEDPDAAGGAKPSTLEELREEAEALSGAYGADAVATSASYGNFEVDIALPDSEWRLAAMIPDGLPYPLVSPLLCPKHPRLREAGRPRLLGALGEVCRGVLGGPMFLVLCEWLQCEGERFLVRAGAEEDAKAPKPQERAETFVERSLRASEEQRAQLQEAERARADRVAYLQSLQDQDQDVAKKPKDKIALEIRNSPGSGAQHDLAGYDDARAAQLVKEAFSAPLTSEDGKMVRVTFIVGGGKAVRSRYSESLSKVLGSALQELGFAQDSTASCTWESGGTFKGQHDTQRNLKMVHVFPRMVRADAADGSATATGSAAEAPGALHKRLAAADFADFTEEVSGWIRRRDQRSRTEALLLYLKEALEDVQEIDRKLREGKDVGEASRRFYGEVGCPDDVAEKVRWLAAALAPKAAGAAADDASGAVLSFDAPAELAAAAAAAGAAAAEGLGGAVRAAAPESDEELLRRRIEQAAGESSRLLAEFQREKPLAEVRASLPARGQRESIQRAIRERQVVVVEGDTGCGKSTQVPQYILEDWVARAEGGAASILVTQPRRISAIGVAERIAAEMDCRCGDLAGYAIRLESKKSARTKILVCTTGVVLRRLENDRGLRGVTHVVVDECHERDLDTDFLLTVLRDLLPSRPTLRVVLMSATVNAQIFRDYFGCGSIEIPGRTFPVTSFYLEHALLHTGFVVEPNGEYSRRDGEELSSSEAAELQQVYERPEYQELIGQPVPRRILEQMHRMDPERINFDLVAAVVRHIHTKVDPPAPGGGKPLGAILVFVPGLGEIRRCIRALTEGSDAGGGKEGGGKGQSVGGLWVLPLHSMIAVADQRLVFQRPQRGLRKVVVTTNIAETSITIDDVEYVVDCGRHKQTKYDPANRISMLVDCVETKANAKQRRGRAGRVKPGVCYHLMNVRKWRRMEDFEKPEMLRVPLDSLCLRIALLGLGHPARFLAKALTPPTEAAVRSSLQQLVELDAVELLQRGQAANDERGGGDDVESSPTWAREEQERLLKAKLKLTPLGTHLASLPVDAGMGKLLVLGCLFGIPRDVCLLAAALSTKSPFKPSAMDKKKDGDKRRLELAAKFVDGALESDHLLLVSLFEQWERLGGKGSARARAWCRQHELDIQTFDTVADMRAHLVGVLVEQGFIAPKGRTAIEATGGELGTGGAETGRWQRRQRERDDDVDAVCLPPCLASVAAAEEEFSRRKRQLLRALLCAALWPNVVLKKADGQLFARSQASLAFHPSSVLGIQEAEAKEAVAGDWNCPACTFFCFGSRDFCPQCGTAKPPPVPGMAGSRPLRHRSFMYGEKVRSDGNPAQGRRAQTYIRDCCGVSVKALFLLGHRIKPDFLSGRASVDGWIHCQAAPRDVAMLLGMRRRLQEVLARRLTRAATVAAAPEGEDPEVINAVTSMLVLDVE